jgi:hypothetical protein
METYHISTKISNGGIPFLPKLPFPDGQEVEVTIEPKNGKMQKKPTYPLRGLPFEYIDPFEPACPPEDWEVLRDDPA